MVRLVKKLCFVAFVIGEKYQAFIPLYIYSILKSYPNYSVAVFCDLVVKKEIKESLKIMSDMGDYQVIEEYSFGLTHEQKLNNTDGAIRSIRWLFYDPMFDEYEYLYMGDIDIFICKEREDLLIQHIKHSKVLGLPYSNYLRINYYIDNPSVHLIYRYILEKKPNLILETIIKKIKKEEYVRKRLSGLHFVKIDDYYQYVRPLFEKYINDITDPQSKLKYRNNESLLYDMIEETSMGLPPISPNSPELDSNHCYSVAYRPHHGIHLGLFRGKGFWKSQLQIVDSYVYHEYYRHYTQLKREDPILRKLLYNATPFIKEMLFQMEAFYGNGIK